MYLTIDTFARCSIDTGDNFQLKKLDNGDVSEDIVSNSLQIYHLGARYASLLKRIDGFARGEVHLRYVLVAIDIALHLLCHKCRKAIGYDSFHIRPIMDQLRIIPPRKLRGFISTVE